MIAKATMIVIIVTTLATIPMAIPILMGHTIHKETITIQIIMISMAPMETMVTIRIMSSTRIITRIIRITHHMNLKTITS